MLSTIYIRFSYWLHQQTYFHDSINVLNILFVSLTSPDQDWKKVFCSVTPNSYKNDLQTQTRQSAKFFSSYFEVLHMCSLNSFRVGAAVMPTQTHWLTHKMNGLCRVWRYVGETGSWKQEVWSLTGDKDRSFLVRSREHRYKWLVHRNLTSFFCTNWHNDLLF